MTRARWLTGLIAVFDWVIGSVALFDPHRYVRALYEVIPADLSLVQRTGALWLLLGTVSAFAFFGARRYPASLLVLSLFHFMEAPADAVYFLTSSGLNLSGKVALACMPFLDLLVGGLLLLLWRQLRTHWVDPLDLTEGGLRRLG